MSLTEPHANTVARQVAECLFGMHAYRVSRAPEKHVTSVAVRQSANATAPLSPILFLWRFITVMLAFALRNLLGDTLCRTITQLHSPQSAHLLTIVNVANHCAGIASLFS